MGGFLRQATAGQARALGPFLDSTDKITPETLLSIANTDIKLVANGAASANKNAGGGTHRVNGEYGVTFDEVDSATLGELKVSCVMAGAVPVSDTYTVLSAQAYDALHKGNSVMRAGTAQSVSGTGLILDAAADYPDDILIGATIELTSGTYAGARGIVTGNVQSTDTLAIAGGWSGGVVPTGTPEFRLYASAAGASLADFANALLDLTNGIEAGVTPRGALRLILAAAAGRLSGGGTATETIRNAVADTKNRIVATVDEDGNRSAITYDQT